MCVVTVTHQEKISAEVLCAKSTARSNWGVLAPAPVSLHGSCCVWDGMVTGAFVRKV